MSTPYTPEKNNVAEHANTLMPWKQKYCLEMILHCTLGGRCITPTIYYGIHVFCWRWSHVSGNVRNNQPFLLSTMEAEYMATSHCMRKMIGLGNLC